MCFSAPASFATAVVTGVIGIVAISRTTQRRELPLALVPLIFAIQQGIEGVLWLTLPEDTPAVSFGGLVNAYLFFAQVFWPVFALCRSDDGARRGPSAPHMGTASARGCCGCLFPGWPADPSP